MPSARAAFFIMEISDQQWLQFKRWQARANRQQKTRPYRGRSQRDPDSVIGYHSRGITPEHPFGERHHLVGLARMNPVYQTIKTKDQLAQFTTKLRESGVVLGDSWEQMIEIPRALHDSPNAEAIHRIEQNLGLDDPLRYVPENATFDDAIAAIPLIAKDQQESRQRIQDLQFRQKTIGDPIGGTFFGFSDAVLNPLDKKATFRNVEFKKKQIKKGKRILPVPNKHIQQVKNQVQQRIFGNRLTGTANTLDTMFQMQGSSLEEAAEVSRNTTARHEEAAKIAREKGGLFGMPDFGISEYWAGKSFIDDQRQKVLRRHLL